MGAELHEAATGGLMGDWACRPVAEKGVYAVYQRGDVEALKERNRGLQARLAEVVHENALLCARLDAAQRELRQRGCAQQAGRGARCAT